MKERPILMCGAMVRATLADVKTMTRRVVKSRKDRDFGFYLTPSEIAGEVNAGEFHNCPYGQPGDRLWVRESGWERPERTAKMMRDGADTWPRFAYAADDWSEQDRADFKSWGFKARPSIHMPRWASRITLEITGVRVERLQEISEADAEQEGADLAPTIIDNVPVMDRREGFAELWESINGPGSWDLNPWVWVIEFKRVNA